MRQNVGSHARRDIPRSGLLLAHDEESVERILSRGKSTYGELQPSLEFAIATAEALVASG